jgi:hypothetical protein
MPDRSESTPPPSRPPGPIDRVQTGVRMERRMVKVLKALAELYDLSLGEFLEDLVRDAFAGRRPLSDMALDQVAGLMQIYGLPPAAPGASAPEGE